MSTEPHGSCMSIEDAALFAAEAVQADRQRILDGLAAAMPTPASPKHNLTTYDKGITVGLVAARSIVEDTP